MLEITGHRPYPPAGGPWIMWQAWRHLLFAHWPVPPEIMRKLIPASLELDTFDGQAWVGVVPFRIDIMPRGLYKSPIKRTFNEINVRTYVTYRGRHPGVWFFSLDASDALAVAGARLTYKLPYFNADITCNNEAERTSYRSSRTHHGVPPAGFEADYWPIGDPFQAQKGSFEYWLTERYCLYARDRKGRPFSGEIHHPPWQLQPAQAEIRLNTMTQAHGMLLPDNAPHLLYARKQEMLAWPLMNAEKASLSG